MMRDPGQAEEVSSCALGAGSDEEMTQLGAALHRQVSPISEAVVVYLLGDLGAGKTTFCRGFIRDAGHKGAVKSPTYTLVETYELESRQYYHMDLYRLSDPEELEFIGVREFFSGNSVCLIEWPGKGEGFLKPADVTVEIEVCGNDQERKVKFTGSTQLGSELVKGLGKA